jgi:hypothetical protein
MRPLFAGVATLALTVAACAPQGPVKVQALVADPTTPTGVRLDDVVLATMTEVSTGKGSLFDARGGLEMAGLTVSDSAKNGDSFATMVKKARGDGGKDMSPNMTFDGTRYVALDDDTFTYFSSWHALESAWLFARDNLKDQSPAVTDHSLLGIDSAVVAADILSLPILPVLESDNAAYAAPLDGWLTLRVGTQGGVPFAMAFPVLAHEFHHRVFHRNVFHDDQTFALWRERVTNTSADFTRSTRIMQGVDEGLADLYSLAATGDPNGLKRIFTQAGGRFVAEGERRALDGDFAKAATYDNLEQKTLDATQLQKCSPGEQNPHDLFADDTFNFYCLGTVLAAALWDGSDNDVETLRNEVEPAVNAALPSVADTLVAQNRLFDADVLLAPVVDNIPPGARRDAVCAQLKTRFQSLVDDGKIPSCN